MVCGFKPLAFALSFFLLAGTSVFIFGVIVLATVRYTADIRQYNEIVRNWNEKYMEEMTHFRFNISHGSGCSHHQMYSDTTPDNLKFAGADFSQLAKYNFFKYHLRDLAKPIMFVPKDVQPNDPSLKINFTIIAYHESCISTFGDSEPKCLVEPKPIGNISLNLLWIDTWNVGKLECGGYGFFRDGKCYIFYKLSDLCYKVEYIPSEGRWQLSSEHGGYGCKPSDESDEKAHGKWSPASYSLVNVDFENGSKPHYEFFDDLVLQIRSARDPILFARQITHGKVELEFTTAIFGQQNTYVGISAMAFGLIIALFSILTCGTFCSRTKWRKKLFDNMREEHKKIMFIKKPTSTQAWTQVLFPRSRKDEEETLLRRVH
jgi:hypothetical protein